MRRVLGVALLVALGLWANNTSFFVTGLETHETRLIAHRGVHHIYMGSDRSTESCHASPVEPITHAFIENTIPSMREAFRLGADVVEIDLHLTQDKVFAVFHDWTLDCRTDGTGVTHEQTYAVLRSLDVGYRIDDGSGTYPMRGQGVGLLTNLGDVLDADMDGKFLLNFKSRRREEGLALANMLDHPTARDQIWGVYGGGPPTRAAIDAVTGLRGFDRSSIKACLIRYAALGWSGYVPDQCRDTLLLVPQNFAGFLWGWPHRFTKRLGDAGTDVVLVGPYDGSGFTSGIDDPESFAAVSAQFQGYVWTNRIELIGPLSGAQNGL